MLRELKLQLLMSYVIFMALTVGMFSVGIYFSFKSILNFYANQEVQEVDQKLKTLADLVANRLTSVNELNGFTSIEAAITLGVPE